MMLSNLTNHKHVQNHKWPCYIMVNMQRKLWEDQHNGKQEAISREVSGFGSPCVLYRPIAPKLTKDFKKKKGFRAHHKFFKVEVSVDRSL